MPWLARHWHCQSTVSTAQSRHPSLSASRANECIKPTMHCNHHNCLIHLRPTFPFDFQTQSQLIQVTPGGNIVLLFPRLTAQFMCPSLLQRERRFVARRYLAAIRWLRANGRCTRHSCTAYPYQVRKYDADSFSITLIIREWPLPRIAPRP